MLLQRVVRVPRAGAPLCVRNRVWRSMSSDSEHADPEIAPAEHDASVLEFQEPGTKGKTNIPKKKPRGPPPTHFLCLPLSHPGLHTQVSALTTGLLESDPPITGLDLTILIPPVRFHLTLGAMALKSDLNSKAPLPTISAALKHLRTIHPHVLEMLGQEPLSVTLDSVGIMDPKQTEKAHIMYVAPEEENEANRRVWEVGRFVYESFQEAGFVTETRPLKL